MVKTQADFERDRADFFLACDEVRLRQIDRDPRALADSETLARVRRLGCWLEELDRRAKLPLKSAVDAMARG